MNEKGAGDLNGCVVSGGVEYKFLMNGIRISLSQLYLSKLSIYGGNVSNVLVENYVLGSREDVHVY